MGHGPKKKPLDLEKGQVPLWRCAQQILLLLYATDTFRRDGTNDMSGSRLCSVSSARRRYRAICMDTFCWASVSSPG